VSISYWKKIVELVGKI